MEKITSFRDDYFFLSNFYYHPFEFEGVVYDTAENAFQAQKAPKNEREKYAHVKPNIAKQMGRKEKLPDDWENTKDGLMRRIVGAKFKDPELMRLLVDTGDAELIEGNNWNDTYWGVSLKTGKGLNKLGKILMEVRNRLQSLVENYNEKYKKTALIDVDAQIDIGYAYEKGQGVEVDFDKAFEFYRMAAEQGDAEARYNLGRMYEAGNGVE